MRKYFKIGATYGHCENSKGVEIHIPNCILNYVIEFAGNCLKNVSTALIRAVVVNITQ